MKKDSQAKDDIASAASDALKVIANAAAEALKVTNAQGSNDHDLIIKLGVKMDSIKEDIRILNDSTANKINDHEARMRTLEKESEDYVIVKKVVYGAVGLVLTTVLGAIIYLVVSRPM